MQKQLITILAVAFALVASTGRAVADDDLRATVRDEIARQKEEKKGKDDGTLKVKWKDGIRLEGKDAKLKMGGRIMLDFWATDDDDFEAAPFGESIVPGTFADARRVRIYFSGDIYKHLEFKLQLDFEEPEEPEFKDIYIGIKKLRDCFGCGAPNIRLGHFKVPFSLDELTSSKYITFMERAAPSNAFAPGRRWGVMLHDRFRGDQMGYQLGGFMAGNGEGDDEPFGEDGDTSLADGWAVAGRLTYAPWWDCGCDCKRLHLGVSAMYLDDLDNNVDRAHRYRTRGGIGFGDRLVQTARIQNDSIFQVGAEVAFVYGPWSVQGEYYIASVNRLAGTDPTFSGWYAQASYWLTGECRHYKGGVFSRVKPCCNFLAKDCCCWGGWEVAARYSFTDLEDSGVTGGEMSVLTLGVNWHLNPNARIMLNYIMADVDGGPLLNNNIANNATLSGFGMRWQVDF
jgi:phosphate-selective porin OprO/OprP